MKKASLRTRLIAKRRSQSMLAGITWYTEETWAQVKATAADPECFEDSFTEWEAMANSARRELQRSGVRAVEYKIAPQEFFDWCAANGKVNKAESRAEFVSAKLREAHEGSAK